MVARIFPRFPRIHADEAQFGALVPLFGLAVIAFYARVASNCWVFLAGLASRKAPACASLT